MSMIGSGEPQYPGTKAKLERDREVLETHIHLYNNHRELMDNLDVAKAKDAENSTDETREAVIKAGTALIESIAVNLERSPERLREALIDHAGQVEVEVTAAEAKAAEAKAAEVAAAEAKAAEAKGTEAAAAETAAAEAKAAEAKAAEATAEARVSAMRRLFEEGELGRMTIRGHKLGQHFDAAVKYHAIKNKEMGIDGDKESVDRDIATLNEIRAVRGENREGEIDLLIHKRTYDRVQYLQKDAAKDEQEAGSLDKEGKTGEAQAKRDQAQAKRNEAVQLKDHAQEQLVKMANDKGLPEDIRQMAEYCRGSINGREKGAVARTNKYEKSGGYQ